MPDKQLGEAAWRGRRPGSGVAAHTAPSRGFSARSPRGTPSQLRRWQPRAGAPRGPARGLGELGGRLPPPTPPPQSTCRPPPPGGGLSGCVTRAFSLARAGSPRGGPRAAGRAEPCDWRRSRSVSSDALSPALPAAGTLSPAPPPTPRPHPSSGARLLLSAGSGQGRRAAEQAPVGAAGAPRSEPWEAPTLRARGAGSRPRRGPRDPERPRESQHPLLPPRQTSEAAVPGFECRLGMGAHGAPSHPGWESGDSRARLQGAGVGRVGRPAPSLTCGARGTHDHDPMGTVSPPGGLLTRARPC